MKEEKEKNIMREIRIEKVTVNMGIGKAGEELERAEKIMEQITNAKPVRTLCKVKQPTWGLRPGLPIGVKVTLRKEKAKEFLERAFIAKNKQLSAKCFDRQGNFGFGIKEHIDLPYVRYDPKLGIVGLDVLVTLCRPGYRIKHRKIAKRKVGRKHLISPAKAMDFIRKNFGVEIT